MWRLLLYNYWLFQANICRDDFLVPSASSKFSSMTSTITIAEDSFGFLKDPKKGTSEIIRRYTLTNKNNVQVQLISYGTIILSVKCPDRKGRIHDVVLGFDALEGFIQNQPAYFGAVVGRLANRVGGGRFKLGGKEYKVTKNLGDNQLHGGLKGFDQAVWQSYVENDKVVFTYLSKDGEEGYPGDLMTQVVYSLSDDNSLKLDFTAMCNQPTPVNLSNHVYFNLAGHCAGPTAVFEHYATINADRVLVTDEKLIPTGEIRSVGGTVYDLRTPTHLGTVMPQVPGGGYDNTMCINGTKEDGVRFVARIYHPPSGRTLEVFSDQPGLQWVNALNLPESDDTVRGKDGAVYRKYSGFCLETENYPDAVNHKHFPDSILRPGDLYRHTCIYRFGTQEQS